MVRDSICTVVAVTGRRELLLCSVLVHPRLGNFLFVLLMPTGVLSQTWKNIVF